jgi:hypothetical protein
MGIVLARATDVQIGSQAVGEFRRETDLHRAAIRGFVLERG